MAERLPSYNRGPRVKRRLFNLLALLSAALFAAVLGLWVRSYWRLDSLTTCQRVSYRDSTQIVTFFTLTSSCGGLKLSHYHCDLQFISPLLLNAGPILQWDSQPAPKPLVRSSPTLWNRLNFDAYTQRTPLSRQTETIRGVVLPHWLIVLMTAFLPTIWWRRWRTSRRRSREGLCRTCGYDLRATPQRCPECGTRSAASASLAGEAE